MPRVSTSPVVAAEHIAQSIVFLRGQRVILDRNLAAIYGVSTSRLNEAVKRNVSRFPRDFMFRLTREETRRSRSQIAILKSGRGQNIKYRPFVFTEHGAVQAANVLNSPRAITMGVLVVRAFIKLRGLLTSNKVLAKKVNELERRLGDHDEAIAAILSSIRQLMGIPRPTGRGIGFTADLREKA